MRHLETSGYSISSGAGGVTVAGGLLLLLRLQEQAGGVRAGEAVWDMCHSVDQVEKLGSKEVEHLVEIDMEEVREVLTKVEALATTAMECTCLLKVAR